MKRLSFKHLLTFTTTLIAGSAAFFSVWGIGKLFAGAAIATMVMAGSLELGKIVAVTFLYRYWNRIAFVMRSYMMAGALMLVVITSGGIYGFLSSAYASGAIGFQAKRSEISLVESQQNSLTTTYTSNAGRIKSNDARIQQLQQFRSQQENRLDSLMGKSGFTTQQRAVQQSDGEIRRLQAESRDIEKQNITLLTSRDSLQQQKLTKEVASNTDSKIGTFWYIANAIGVPLDTVVKWFILMIVFVFDPLSMALVIAYNVIKKEEENKEPDIPPAPPTPDDKTPLPMNKMLWPETIDAAWAGIETEPDVEHTEQKEPLIEESLPVSTLPYYLQPDFDWNNHALWIHDPAARAMNEQLSKSRG
jgi:hypothetical protein